MPEGIITLPQIKAHPLEKGKHYVEEISVGYGIRIFMNDVLISESCISTLQEENL